MKTDKATEQEAILTPTESYNLQVWCSHSSDSIPICILLTTQLRPQILLFFFVPLFQLMPTATLHDSPEWFVPPSFIRPPLPTFAVSLHRSSCHLHSMPYFYSHLPQRRSYLMFLSQWDCSFASIIMIQSIQPQQNVGWWAVVDWLSTIRKTAFLINVVRNLNWN